MEESEHEATMDEELEEDNAKSQKNPRNAKLKVLVRSHAMREEQSPPRVPTPQKLSPSSPVNYSNPVVVLSPSISRGGSPCRSLTSCVSPTSTLVPSPNTKHSPRCLSPSQEEEFRNYDDGNDNETEFYNNDVGHSSTNSLSGHSEGKRRYHCDSTQECTNCSKEKYGNNNSISVNPNTLSVGRINGRGKFRQQSSSQGSLESSHPNSPCLSRDSSAEHYTDSTGIDLEIFIPETLNRNAKDRALMLRIEQELVSLAKDKSKNYYKFPPMSSYQRMLVHRCAAYFGMEHNIESSGKCVVVNKTKNTRIPCVSFKEHIKDEMLFSEEPRRSILKRDSNSIDDCNYKSPDRHFMDSRQTKSFEEREEEYEKVRKRIFKGQRKDSSSVDDIIHWSDVLPWSSTDSETSTKYRLQLPEYQVRRQGKLLKVQSEEVGETMRPHVSKSYSFGGYGGVLNRGDSMMSTHSAGPRLLTKQDSAASSVSWRLSPSSSGYKSQSQMSESVTPSPTSTPIIRSDSKRQDSMNSEYSNDKHQDNPPVVWAVTDIDRVPKGSLIINPQTGQPIKNPDGSLYHYDPENPPGHFTTKSPSTNVSPQKSLKATPPPLPISPLKKKSSSKYSPIRRLNTTNSSTSPSLPYSPPVSLTKSFTFPTETTPHHYPVYNASFPPVQPEASMPLYQPPCIVYGTTYGVPLQTHYENRIPVEAPLGEMAPNYFIPDGASNQLMYQQPASGYWTQPFYQNQTQPRYPLVQSSGCFPQNFVQQTQQVPPGADMMVFPNQATYAYQNQPQPNPMVFPNLYNQTQFNSAMYQQYPQNTSTPNSCASSVSLNFQNQTLESPPPLMQQQHQQIPSVSSNVQNLTQNMAQMNLNASNLNQTHFVCNKMMPQQYDSRTYKTGTPKGLTVSCNNGKLNTSKGFLLNSSQSSTGTNSPAATVIAGFCPQNPGMYRTPPETPPTPCAFIPNMNMVFRPMGNIRAPTPGTNRSSRSPTPASDVSHFSGQRMSLPPTVYHGMPYIVQNDTRIVAGRGQPTTYRQPAPSRQQSYSQNSDNNRSHKGKKTKNYKIAGLPPTGKS